ncbi:sugar kinase [Microtetraspora niveoalba]|uniref:sugar kinase n=1 Tax=Microtetraspora niveoalba TaxID=46175 RepID=UPI00082E9542|nr:sugar kinase [Microtetraspora niveoalba]
MAERQRNGVVTLGETMALLTAERTGPLRHAPSMAVGIGGAESNVAIALRRLGVPATWIGRVGADGFGDLVLRELRAEDLDVRGIVDDGAPTGLMVKERRTNRSLNVWYYRAGSAGSRLRPADVPEEDVAGAALLHVTGITPALSDSAAEAVRHAVGLARRHGVTVSFDVNYRARLWGGDRAAERLSDILRGCDVLFAGVEEAELFVPAENDPLDLAAALADLGPSQVVVKLGAEGCAALVDGRPLVRPAVPVDVLDPVGAGDAFVGGYLAELLAGAPPETRLDTAVTAGAFACTVSGDWEGLPTRAELGLLAQREDVAR